MLLKSMTLGEEAVDGARVDPRVTRTRQMLEDAFMQLFWKEGFEAMTVRDITKLAGVNRATFYAHFEDKYALFTYAIEKGLGEIIQTRLPKDATFNEENLKVLILALVDFFALGNDLGCNMARNLPVRPLIESRVQEKIAHLLLTWLHATPNLRLRTSPEVTATMISWTIFGLGLSYTRNEKQKINQAEIYAAVEVILHGATVEEEVKAGVLSHSIRISNQNRQSERRDFQRATVN